jgi:gas vesicle protein
LEDPPSTNSLTAPDNTTQNQVTQINNSLQSVKDQSYNAVTQANQNEIDDIFNTPIQTLQNTKAEVKSKIATLSLPKQQEVISFWRSAAGYFDNVINWIKRQLNRIIGWLREGLKYIKDCVYGAFNLAQSSAKKAFHWLLG